MASGLTAAICILTLASIGWGYLTEGEIRLSEIVVLVLSFLAWMHA